MRAMVISRLTGVVDDALPLELMNLPDPIPGRGEILVDVVACGVCHTELDEIEGRTPPARLPMVPGHQVVGRVAKLGPGATRFQVGERIGIAWIHWACGQCDFCLSGQENLCPAFSATGRDADGGYAERTTVLFCASVRFPDPCRFFRRRSCTPAVCRRRGISVAETGRTARRRVTRANRVWRFRAPCAPGGTPPASGCARVRLRPQRT